jgi:hypothetical protein
VREGPLQRLLEESAVIRVRVGADQVDTATSLLSDMAPTVSSEPSGLAGQVWLEIRRPPEVSAEINQRLAQAGIYASGLETGSDLEAVFLSATAAAPSPSPTGPPVGWGQAGPLGPPPSAGPG